MRRSLVIAGGSGFLGRTLAKYFEEKGWGILVLTRRPDASLGFRQAIWDGRTLGAWAAELDGADVLINLAGRSVNCRYTPENRRAMMDSRVESTEVLGLALANCAKAPAVWMNSSTATIYRHRYDAANDEFTGLRGATPEAKDEFSIKIAEAWEAAFERAIEANGLSQVRPVILRAAMVFGEEPGGVYHTLARLTRFGLGGTMGEGRQWVSWMHALDFCRSIEWLIENETARGVYNLSAPEPVTNQEMMRLLREVLGKSIGLPAYRWMLEIGAWMMRTETELIVKSRRVVPARLLREGFEFRFERMRAAIEDLRGEE